MSVRTDCLHWGHEPHTLNLLMMFRRYHYQGTENPVENDQDIRSPEKATGNHELSRE